MKRAFVTVFLGAVFAVACAGGIKGIENSGKKLGDDVKDAPLTKDIEEGGTKLGNEVADASVTKDVSDGANKVGDDVSGKDAGAPAKPTPAKKKKPKK